MEEEQAQLLLRMPLELKNQLQQEANAQGRKLTQEINMRLRASLKPAAYALPSSVPPLTAEQPRASYGNTGLSEVDKAMLAVFRAMPVDKQLALLSLFK